MTKENLSMEQLENVSGGNAGETAADSRFLNNLNGSTDRYGAFKIKVENHDSEIIRAWSALGVAVVLHSGNFFSNGDANEYYINGKKVSQGDARVHAMKVTGHIMDVTEWSW